MRKAIGGKRKSEEPDEFEFASAATSEFSLSDEVRRQEKVSKQSKNADHGLDDETCVHCPEKRSKNQLRLSYG
jgi:hypothetical protein